jgi:molecular chaperone HscB
VICWSCERAAGDGHTCVNCGAVQPPDPSADFFRVLGVPRKYSLDLGDAEARFKELSRQLHPDRFAQADARARRASLQHSVLLNEAWRTIRDPVRRAEYLLRLVDHGLDAEEGAGRGAGLVTATAAGAATRATAHAPAGEGATPPRGPAAASPALLGEILDLREVLAQARAEGDDARVLAMAVDIRGRVDAALARVAAALGRAEVESTAAPAAWEEASRELVPIRYFRRFLDEVAIYEDAIAERALGDARG